MRSMISCSDAGGCPRFVSLLMLLGIFSYFCLYGLIPDAYAVGPAIIFLFALFFLKREDLLFRHKPDYSNCVSFVSIAYCLVQWGILLFHGEDISEFDLPLRYIIAGTVLLFLVKVDVPASLIFMSSAVGALLAGIFAFYQIEFGNAGRVDAFDNAIHFGNAALTLSLICFCGLLAYRQNQGEPLKVFFLGIAFVAGSYATLASGSRGVWVSVPVVITVLAMLYWKRFSSLAKIKAAAAFLIVLSALSVVNFNSIMSRVDQGVSQYQEYFASGKSGNSVALRFDMWKAGLVAFREQPVIGVGPAGVDRVVGRLVDEGKIHQKTATFRHLHSQYVDILARQGLVGLAFYGLLIFSIVAAFASIFRDVRVNEKGHALAAVGIAYIAQHLVLNLTLSMLERSIGLMMFLFLVVFLMASASSERRALR